MYYNFFVICTVRRNVYFPSAIVLTHHQLNLYFLCPRWCCDAEPGLLQRRSFISGDESHDRDAGTNS